MGALPQNAKHKTSAMLYGKHFAKHKTSTTLHESIVLGSMVQMSVVKSVPPKPPKPFV